jgi:protoheme IX farnesyltransferase
MSQQTNTLEYNSFAGIVRTYFELTKPGITLMVLISMMIGFFMGSLSIGFNWIVFLHVAFGTFLTASGTSAYNQYVERDLDKLMKRTSKRPLPTHKITALNAFLFSAGLILLGVAYLTINVNPVAAAVSTLTSILYLGFYTPLKRKSFMNVFIGSIPGALPPVGGWAAATGSIDDIGMWLLFGIVFLWQIPHVIAIAWLCNEDYTKAGFVMLPKNDKNGAISSYTSLISALLLIPISILIFYLSIAGLTFLVSSLIAAIIFTVYAWKHLTEKQHLSARKLMFASLIYLPVVWVSLFIDRIIPLFF